MQHTTRTILAAATSALALLTGAASAEQTALVLYETKGADQSQRQDGIAFIELDPQSADYGQILAQIPLPPEFHSHHIFYNPARTKAYVTSLATPEIRVLDVTEFPYRHKSVEVADCEVGEDVSFSEAQGKWYLTCMGSSVVIVGDAETDEVLETVAMPAPWPHGIATNDAIDRQLVTSTANPFSEAPEWGEEIVVLQPSTGEILSTHKVSNAQSPSGAGPVEAFFVPGVEPALVYVTNMEGSLWLAEWQPDTEEFTFREEFRFDELGQGVTLEVYFNEANDRAYVTSAIPGHLNAFDITDPRQPEHLWAAEAAGGAHHLVFSEDGSRAYVQNSLLNIDGMNDGSISVIDLETGEKTGSIDTFKDAGLTINTIVLTPEAEDFHSH
jgi:DNA-binding beta-propeller fold protein YncE